MKNVCSDIILIKIIRLRLQDDEDDNNNGSNDYVKGVTRSDELTENYHRTLQFPSALWSFIVYLRSLFCVYGPQIYCFGSLSQCCFRPQQATIFGEKRTHCCLPSLKKQTDKS